MTRQFVREISLEIKLFMSTHDKRYRYYIEVNNSYIKVPLMLKNVLSG